MDIKRLRKEKGISQVKIAKSIGVHLNTYALWERGGGKPSPENLEKLKAALGIKK